MAIYIAKVYIGLCCVLMQKMNALGIYHLVLECPLALFTIIMTIYYYKYGKTQWNKKEKQP